MARKQSGFTLAELLVVLAINLILFAGLTTLIVANLNHYRVALSTMRLNQQLQSALLLMGNDIRRAGYWSNASSDVGGTQNNNPFMTNATDITVSGGNCVLFTYDQNGDGSLPAIDASIDDERYGYRLNGQVLQARPPGASFSCGANASEWENITDTQNIQITSLAFTLTTSTLTTGPGTKGLVQRAMDISITGRLGSDNTITRTFTQHIRIKNDKFVP